MVREKSKTNHGGARPRSGRKKSAVTLLREQLIKEQGEQAAKSFELLVNFRNDPSQDPWLRIKCAQVILAYVIGKPKQALVLGVDPGNRRAGVLTIRFARPDD